MQSISVRMLVAGMHVAGNDMDRERQPVQVGFHLLQFVPVNTSVTGKVASYKQQIRVALYYLLSGLFPVLDP